MFHCRVPQGCGKPDPRVVYLDPDGVMAQAVLEEMRQRLSQVRARIVRIKDPQCQNGVVLRSRVLLCFAVQFGPSRVQQSLPDFSPVGVRASARGLICAGIQQ